MSYLTFERNNVTDVIPFDATLSETHTFDAEVTEHAVETGSAVNDNVRAKPRALKLDVLIVDMPLTKSQAGEGSEGRAAQYLNTLDLLRENGDRVKVFTSVRSYENLAIKNLTTSRDKPTKGALKVSIQFVEVLEVKTETVQVRTVQKAKKPLDTGKQATKTTDAKTEDKSWFAGGIDKATEGLKKLVSK